MIDTTATKPQTIAGIVFVPAGHCVVCHSSIYAEGDDDPDPRGDVDEKHARVTLTPDRTGGSRTVCTCYRCANDGASYRAACKIAEGA
jgi:hypothetical protein